MISQKGLDQRRTSFIPTWASLRSIGNSRAVQASVAFPVIGYLVLLSSQFTSIFDGGLIGGVQHHQEADWWSRMWSLKLYFVYFGLLFLGVGSALYQYRCPRQIKKHGDWEDYVRVDGPAMTRSYIKAIGEMMGLELIGAQSLSWEEAEKAQTLRLHYAMLSAEAKYSRLAVAFFFFYGLGLLTVPSLMTVIKITAQFFRN
ncbi:hypothetical protein QA649_24630 [Bradyrhizobium sp. CB1717]|uniref:hypothetical protein n=1 Tax=Bradyrhizobium sp. CB1717 TaxID=3039154 RepID=UPI0024B27443|nr:hypothetical protein [Bradyrhizobium sp. CB1717]WFU21295.1 hypothetical protein QA649_24630 [Bradyrhizobium sp. CB1717]